MDWKTEPCFTCGKPVIRATNASGKTLFVNPEPDITNGTVKLVERYGVPLAVTPPMAKRFGMKMRVNHDKTCNKWRGKPTIKE